MLCITYYLSYEIFRYQKLLHAYQTLRKIIRSNTSLLQVHKDTNLIKLYWSHLFDILIIRQFLINQPSDKRMLTNSDMWFALQTITIQRHYKLSKIEKSRMNRVIFFFCNILCLFVNLVPSASFRHKRKASKMGGVWGGLQNLNLPTL